MEEKKIISHEIGHGIICYMFNGEYWTFKGITFAYDVKLNNQDLAYTISEPVKDLPQKVDQNNHLAAAIDGLLLLAGIAGQTVFESTNIQVLDFDATKDNFKEYYDFEGSSGDFEIIKKARRPYGWYLFDAGKMSDRQAEIRHLRLLNLLKNIFRDAVIMAGFEILKDKFHKNKKLNIEDFYEAFDSDFMKNRAEEVKQFIKSGLGKPILIE